MRRAVPRVLTFLVFGGLTAHDVGVAPGPLRDLDVGIPPGSPTTWARRFPAITPRRGPVFPETARRSDATASPHTVARAETVDMDVHIANSFGIVRILTWDLTGHLSWLTGDFAPAPTTGRSSKEVPLPKPGEPVYWASIAALLRLMLHPQMVAEAAVIAHLTEIGEPVLAVLPAAEAEASLREPCRVLRKAIGVSRRMAAPLAGKTPRETMLLRFLADELVASHPYDPVGDFGRRFFLFADEMEPLVIRYTTHADSFLRRNATAALGRYRTLGAVKALAQLASATDDPVVLMRALAALGEYRGLGDPEPLIERLGAARDPAERVALIEALGRVDAQQAVPRLLALAGSRDADARQAALAALARIRPDEAHRDAVLPLARRIARATRKAPEAFAVKAHAPSVPPDTPDSSSTHAQILGQLALLVTLQWNPTDESTLKRLLAIEPEKREVPPPGPGSPMISGLAAIHPPVQLLFIEALRNLGPAALRRLVSIAEDAEVDPALRGFALSQLPYHHRAPIALEILDGSATAEMKIYAFEVLASDGHDRLVQIAEKLLDACEAAPPGGGSPEQRYLWMTALRALSGRGRLDLERARRLLKHPAGRGAAHETVVESVRRMIRKLTADAAAGLRPADRRTRIAELIEAVIANSVNPSIREPAREAAQRRVDRLLSPLAKGVPAMQVQLVALSIEGYLLGSNAARRRTDGVQFTPVVLLEDEILFALGRLGTAGAAEAIAGFLAAHAANPLRAQACLALGMTRQGGDARKLVPFLHDADGFVRFCAYESLRRLTGQDFWADWMYGGDTERKTAEFEYLKWCVQHR